MIRSQERTYVRTVRTHCNKSSDAVRTTETQIIINTFNNTVQKVAFLIHKININWCQEQ